MKKILGILTVIALLFSMAIPTVAASKKVGDATGDGAIDMKDVLVIRKYMAKLPTDIDLKNADTNADGAVNMKDVLLIRKHMARLINLDDVVTGDPNVPVMTEIGYGLDNNGNVLQMDYKITYNCNDDVLTDEMYDEDGTIFSSSFYEYDEKGRVIHEKYDDLTEVVYTYNENGDLLTAEYDGECANYYYEENEQGRTVTIIYEGETYEIEKYNQNNQITLIDFCDGSKYEYFYDENGFQIKTILYWDNEIGAIYEYEIDNNGNQTLCTEKTAKGDIVGTTSCRYDTKGHLIEQKESSVYITSWIQYTYDDSGNEIEMRSLDANGNVESITEYKYNEKGQLIEEKEYEPNGEIYYWEKIEYQYS